MKNLNKIVLSIYFFVILIVFFTNPLQGQVITRVLAPDDKIENYIPWYNPEEKVPIVKAPFLNVAAILDEDRQKGRHMPRYSIRQHINLTERNGFFDQVENYSIWNMCLFSQGAKSISIGFRNSSIPKNAEMFLYNEKSRVVVGPINSTIFDDGLYFSDFVDGDNVNVTVFIPGESKDGVDLNLNLTSYDYGIFENHRLEFGYGTSAQCHENFACQQGWECQGKAVCKIQHPNIGSCSGTLINNDCCDLTPYILTADHCLRNGGVGDLNDFSEYIFKFKYESASCTPTSEPLTWLTFDGASLISHWDLNNGTDFGLLRLNTSIRNSFYSGDLSFSGWDRREQTNRSQVSSIHHPQGDVKKISIDNAWPIYDQNYLFVDDWDIGTTEPGSSGGPFFDLSKRIIGIVSSGEDTLSACNPEKGTHFGRFDLSWDGNGYSTGNLKNHLGASSNPLYMDCIESNDLYIEGPGLLCNGYGQFRLFNFMPCNKNVEWSVSPGSLFTGHINGIGNIANVQVNPLASGRATITYTLSGQNCEPMSISHDFWVGKPELPQYYIAARRCLARLFITNNYSFANTTYTFFVRINCGGSSSMQVYVMNPGQTAINIPIPYGQSCEICIEGVSASNPCGAVFSDERRCSRISCTGERQTESEEYLIASETADESIKVFPNPAIDHVYIGFSEEKKDVLKAIRVIDITGKVLETFMTNEQSIKTDLTAYPPGVYLLLCQIKGEVLIRKIVKL